jgi:hypothetical protein
VGGAGSEGEVNLFLVTKTTTTMIKIMFNVTDSPSTPPRMAGVTTKELHVNKLKQWLACPYLNNRHGSLSSVVFDFYQLVIMNISCNTLSINN